MLKISGLNTSTNDFLSPEGSLQVAKNINIPVPNLAKPRKGFEQLTSVPADQRVQYMTHWKDRLIVVHSDSGFSAVKWLNDSNNLSSLSGIFPNSSTSIHTAQASGGLFITTARGIKKFDQLGASDTEFCGMPTAITPTTTNITGSWLAVGDTVAYRVVFVREDANKNLLVGVPSSRALYTNATAGPVGVRVRANIPTDVISGDRIRLCRSVAVSTGDPNDELQLVLEAEIGPTELTNDYIDLDDVLDESLLGAFLYTNASQEGLENANYRPPSAEDIAVYDNCLFAGNTRTRDAITLTLNDAGLLSNGDTLTFTPDSGTPVTVTAAALEDTAAQEFQLYTSGTAEENTRNTAKSIVRIISQRVDSDTYTAQYLENETAGTRLGEFLVENRSAASNPFTVTASNADPFLPSELATGETSSNDAFANGLVWSKPFEPEAFPLPNQTRIGSKAAAIQRIVALDEALIIFKEDGIYRLTGFYPDFQVELMDASVKLVGSRTLAVLSNEIYCLTNQGVVVVNTNGVRIISTPIEDKIFELFDTQLDNIETYSFGVAREDKRQYYLWHPESVNDTAATQAYVYNIYTKTWTLHTIEATAATAINGSFWYGDPNSEYIYKERSTGTNRDYADYSFSTTVTATSGTTITLNSGTDNISVGDVLFESTTIYALITAVDTLNSQVTVASNPGFTNTSVDILSSIPTEIKWLPNAVGRPEINKQIHTVTPLFKRGFVGECYLDFSTDISPGTESVQLSGTSLLGWGLSAWGSAPWGNTPDRKPYRQWVPRSKQRCNWLTIGIRHAYAFSGWELQGIRFIGDLGDEKTGK